MEEIFERAELKFDSLDAMKSWLDGFSKRDVQNDYTRDGTLVYKEVVEAIDLRNSFEDVTSTDELRDFESKLDDLDLDVEIVTEEELREKELAIAEALADIVRNPVDIDIYNEALKELREVAPQKLGGLKRGEQQKALKGLRDLFK